MEDTKANPSNTAQTRATVSRIPMSVPQLKLAVPEIPGFHLHWMSGNPNRIAAALRAGYTFVDKGEVEVNNFNIADNAEDSGDTDMGSRISISSGNSLDDNNQPERLYLMKIPQELWEADQEALADRNESIAASLRGGTPSGKNFEGMEYIPEQHSKGVHNLFTRKR